MRAETTVVSAQGTSTEARTMPRPDEGAVDQQAIDHPQHQLAATDTPATSR
jgi:hypothetical protein